MKAVGPIVLGFTLAVMLAAAIALIGMGWRP